MAGPVQSLITPAAPGWKGKLNGAVKTEMSWWVTILHFRQQLQRHSQGKKKPLQASAHNRNIILVVFFLLLFFSFPGKVSSYFQFLSSGLYMSLSSAWLCFTEKEQERSQEHTRCSASRSQLNTPECNCSVSLLEFYELLWAWLPNTCTEQWSIGPVLVQCVLPTQNLWFCPTRSPITAGMAARRRVPGFKADFLPCSWESAFQ